MPGLRVPHLAIRFGDEGSSLFFRQYSARPVRLALASFVAIFQVCMRDMEKIFVCAFTMVDRWIQNALNVSRYTLSEALGDSLQISDFMFDDQRPNSFSPHLSHFVAP